jgi:hypothetical protein
VLDRARSTRPSITEARGREFVDDVRDDARSTVTSVASIFGQGRLTQIPVLQKVVAGLRRLRGPRSAAGLRRLLV